MPDRDELTTTERRLLGTMRQLWQRQGASIVTMQQVCTSLGMPPEEVEPAARRLESKGILVCSPSSGRVAVLILTRRPQREEVPEDV